MIWVTEAQHLGNHVLTISFSDGRSGRVDLRDFIFRDSREIFQQLRDVDRFVRFTVDMDTVVWENGADLAPEFLYALLTADATQSVRENEPQRRAS